MVNIREHRGYETLLCSLANFPYFSLIDFDENRGLDGIALRDEFEERYSVDVRDFGFCSVLEVLIALARRMEHELYDPGLYEPLEIVPQLFWEMIENLKLTPDISDINLRRVEIWLDRNFERNGAGSPFPLKNPRKDQRKTELWYQMQAYLMEKF